MTQLRTFTVPETVQGNESDLELALAMISAWQVDGIFQVATGPTQSRIVADGLDSSRRFFAQPMAEKKHLVSELTYSGYIASGEEMTAGEADFSEIFTVCKDVPTEDPRVRSGWPCHGPVPWPNHEYRYRMSAVMEAFGSLGERLLRLVALGLGLDLDALTQFTNDGWHHMRVLHFPTRMSNSARGIGAHTDYGLLVIAAQDDVGGLYVRPPVTGEHRNRNWLPTESTAGMYENQEPWHFVTPVPNVLTVFPGDILQFLTGGYLLSTPHKVRLSGKDRYTMAYFHEPNFEACVRPLLEESSEFIHYGTHFTNMFMRCYPDRITTTRIIEEDRLLLLDLLRTEAVQRTAVG